MTTISVVVPVKDDARELEQCLAALRAQTRPADEIIVVDNDSSDDSAEVAHRFGVTVVTEHRKGIWAASAAGFDAAAGDIIARLDADSRPDPTWIGDIERALAGRPDAVAITGPGRFYNLSAPLRVLADVLYMRAYFVMARGALANRALFGSNFAIRASVWQQVAGAVHRDDPEVHDDLDLSFHLDPASTVLFDSDLVVGISARPFGDASGMVVRTRRAIRTMTIHGFAQQPMLRWRRRILASRPHRRRDTPRQAEASLRRLLGRGAR